MLAVLLAAYYVITSYNPTRETETTTDPEVDSNIQAGREAARMLMEEGEARVRDLLRPQNFAACPDSDLKGLHLRPHKAVPTDEFYELNRDQVRELGDYVDIFTQETPLAYDLDLFRVAKSKDSQPRNVNDYDWYNGSDLWEWAKVHPTDPNRKPWWLEDWMALRNMYEPRFRPPPWVSGLESLPPPPLLDEEENERREARIAVDAHIAGELQEALDTVDALIASEQPGTERPPPSMAQAVAAASKALALRTPGALLKIAQALGRIPTASARFMAYMRPWWGTATMLAIWVAALYLLTYNTPDRETTLENTTQRYNISASVDEDSNLSLPPSTTGGKQKGSANNGAACPDALRE